MRGELPGKTLRKKDRDEEDDTRVGSTIQTCSLWEPEGGEKGGKQREILLLSYAFNHHLRVDLLISKKKKTGGEEEREKEIHENVFVSDGLKREVITGRLGAKVHC